MKIIIISILIVLIKMCASESSVYDWRVRTIERDPVFGDDLNVQMASNNERERGLEKVAGQANNIDYDHDSHYASFNKNIDNNENKAAEFKGKNQNSLINKIGTKYEEKANFQSALDQNNNYTREQGSKKGNTFSYSNDNDYGPEEDQQNNQNAIFVEHQQPLFKDDSERFLNNFLLNKARQLDNKNDELNYISHSYHTDQDEYDKEKQIYINEHIGINAKNKVSGNKNNEIKNGTTLLKKHDKTSNVTGEIALLNHCAGKHIDIESFVGTNLFDRSVKKCFSTEDVALLATRKDFENLIPKDLPQSLLDDHMVALLMNYFYICHQIVIRATSVGSRHLAQKAFYDTLGGYLNFYMVPVTKYSYYAGQISLNTAQQVITLHQESRKFLNTNGNGWKAPLRNVLLEFNSIRIEALHIPELNKDTQKEPSFCMNLDMNTYGNQTDDKKMIVELPKLETENVRGFLGNIWLPFRNKQTFDLKSESSAYIVVTFYETVTKCYRFKNIDQKFYNEQFKTWLLENISIHLSDDEFYPGLGAVLRIQEYLKNCKKDFIGIGADLTTEMKVEDGLFKINQNISSKLLPTKMRSKQNEINYAKVLNESDRDSSELAKVITNQQTKVIAEKDNKLKAAVDLMSNDSKGLLRTLDFTPPQIAIISIPVVAIILVVIICCCKKKKSKLPIKPTKNSSSSSSNLFQSPVRFFHIRKKSASGNTIMGYSSNEVGKNKSEKFVKINKKPLMNSDSSVSSSPVRTKKSKDSTLSKSKGKNKESGKSNV